MTTPELTNAGSAARHAVKVAAHTSEGEWEPKKL